MQANDQSIGFPRLLLNLICRSLNLLDDDHLLGWDSFLLRSRVRDVLSGTSPFRYIRTLTQSRGPAEGGRGRGWRGALSRPDRPLFTLSLQQLFGVDEKSDRRRTITDFVCLLSSKHSFPQAAPSSTKRIHFVPTVLPRNAPRRNKDSKPCPLALRKTQTVAPEPKIR